MCQNVKSDLSALRTKVDSLSAQCATLNDHQQSTNMMLLKLLEKHDGTVSIDQGGPTGEGPSQS